MADSDTTQQKSFHARLAEPKQVTVSSEAFNKLKVLAEDIWAKAALAEPKQVTVSREAFNKLKVLAEDIWAKAAAREAEAKQVTVSREAFNKLKVLAEDIRAKAAAREAQKKEIAEAKALAEDNALIANSRAEREANAIANGRLKQADAPSHKKAGPFLTTSQWLCVIGLGASLVARPFYGELLPN